MIKNKNNNIIVNTVNTVLTKYKKMTNDIINNMYKYFKILL